MIDQFIKTIIVLTFLQINQAVKIFFIGGGSNQNSTLVFGQLANIVPGKTPLPKKCIQDWSKTTCPKIAVVTSAADTSIDGNDAWSNDTDSMSYKTMFLNFGMAPKHISAHRDNYKTHSNGETVEGKMNIDILNDADVVYFNGGDQSRHLRTWMKDDNSDSDLLKVLRARMIKNEVICAGTSAGSMIWGPQTFGEGNSFGILYFSKSVGLANKSITDGGINGTGLLDVRNGTKSLQYDYNGGKMPSFNIVKFLTDTHFNARGRLARLPTVLSQLGQPLGIGVDQNTSLYYNNGVGTVYGWNGVTVVNINQAVPEPANYFILRNIIGHYLTAGDKLDFATNTVTSNKTIINTPYYSNPTDSNDITAAYQAPLLQTRLVDQKASYNLGRTKTPSAFPRSTPTFEIKFYKNSQTKGYYSDKKYTSINILYDFYFGTNSNLAIQLQ